MLISILIHEVKLWLKKPVIYLYFFIFFAFTLVSFLGTGGFFDATVESNGILRLLNSPHELNYLFLYLNKLFLFLLPAIIGNSIYQDFRFKVYPFLYSYPINKKHYLSGKFLGAFFIVLIISLSSALAFLLGECLLGINNPILGPFSAYGYLNAYVFFILPNLFVIGIMVFSLVALSRNIYYGFVLILLVFLFQLITENIFSGNDLLVALLDPFGQNAVLIETQFWTLAEQNTLNIPISGEIVMNRIFWAVCSFSVALILFKFFHFLQDGIQFQIGKTKIRNNKKELPHLNNKVKAQASFNFSPIHQFKLVLNLSCSNFKFLVGNPMFYFFAMLGVISIVLMLLKVMDSGELVMLPLTRLILSIPTFFYISIITLITFIFSGILVNRERLVGINELINSSPVGNGILLISKVLALFKVQLLLLLFLFLTGIILQVGFGFYTIDFSQYFIHLTLFLVPTLLVWAVTAVFIHSLISNQYFGLFILLLIWVAKEQLSELGFSSFLLQFNTPPQLIYSDINGYGSLLLGVCLIQLYWLSLGLLLLFLSYLFWRREYFFTFQDRLNLAKSRMGLKYKLVLVFLITLVFTLGLNIYTEEQKGNKVVFGKKEQTKFENRFAKFKNIPSPQISTINIEMELYPETNSFKAKGFYTLVNRNNKPIDTLLIKTGFDEISTYELNIENKLIASDSLMKFYVHHLVEPLQVNDSLQFYFEIQNVSNTLFQLNSNVYDKGSFLKQDILPRFGYFFPSKIRHPSDALELNTHYQAADSYLINYEATISTSGNQTAITAGSLKKHWKENGRNYYQFKTDLAIKMGMAFSSGIFELKKEKWKNISIELFFYPEHKQNLNNFINGIKAALDYNTRFFSPYQHKDIKLIEFPVSEGTYSTLLGNTILTSEQQFGVNTEVNDKIDLPFYVAVHEFCHNWFGNQLLPKNALGAAMLTESITEYLSYKIYEKEFGEEAGLKFLAVQRLRYLRGRANEKKSESPLYLIKTEQDYISYGKGAMAFNALSTYLGEKKLNGLLNSFLLEYGSLSGKLPTSLDLIKKLKDNTPKELHYLILDYFESIVFYENSITSAGLEKTDKGYTVSVDFLVNKDAENSAAASLPLNDFIEIGLYDQYDSLLTLKSVQIQQNMNTMKFHLSQKPAKIKIDPRLLTIEKDITNNTYNL